MQETADGMNHHAAEQIDLRLEQDAVKIRDVVKEEHERQNELLQEREKLRVMVTQAVAPSLKGTKINAQQYTDDWLKLVDAHATRMEALGIDPVETLKKFTVERAGLAPQKQFELMQSGLKTPEEKLEEDVRAWEKTVDGHKPKDVGTTKTRKNKEPREPVVMLKQTPLVLQMLGVKNRQIVTNPRILKKIFTEKHKLSPELVKQVPAALADPIMIFESAKHKGRFVAMLGIKNERGSTVVVPLEFGYKTVYRESANLATSIYVKDYRETDESGNQWFGEQITENRLLYQNKKKSHEWSQDVGLQLPKTPQPHGLNKKLYTEADLAKLKEQFPDLYQGSRGMLSGDRAGWVISLFQQADPSTLFHETAHVFFEEIEAAVNSGRADEALQADYQTLQKWLARFDDQTELKQEYELSVKDNPVFKGKEFDALTADEKKLARTIAEKEYFARGFEAYLLEGKAPAKSMQGMFTRFKRWLTAIYKTVGNLQVELNEEVRNVFSNIIAADNEAGRALSENDMLGLSPAEMKALGMTKNQQAYVRKLTEAALIEVSSKLTQERNKNRQERLRRFKVSFYGGTTQDF